MVNSQNDFWSQFSDDQTQPASQDQSDLMQRLQQKDAELNPNRPKQQNIQSQQQQSPDQQKKFEWSDYNTNYTYAAPEDEGWMPFLIRNIISGGSRVAESYAGRYGDIEKAARVTAAEHSWALGVPGWALEQLVGEDKWKQLVLGPGYKDNEDIQTMLPSSTDFKKRVEAITGDYTKPKSKSEEIFQEFASDVGSTLQRGRMGLPKTRGRTINQRMFNTFVTPVAANIVKQTIKETGFSENAQNTAKFITWLGLSLWGNVDAHAYSARMMNGARKGMPQYLQANNPQYTQNIQNVARNFLHNDERTQLARNQITGIMNDIQNGQTNIHDLMTRYDSINAARSSRGLFELTQPQHRNYAIKSINQVQDVVRKEIENLGKANPRALNTWKNGLAAMRTYHQSQWIGNWARRIVDSGKHDGIRNAADLFGVAKAGGATALAGIVGASGIYKAVQLGYRMWNNPHLRNMYLHGVQAALEGDQVQFLKILEKLNKAL